jgi:hypothetical protein
VSAEIAEIAGKHGWPSLPSVIPCPPSTGSADVVHACLRSWAGFQGLGPKTVLCVPSKAVDAWLAAATFDHGHALLIDLECNLALGGQLAALPKDQRVRKSAPEYRARQRAITSAWDLVRQRCSQAERFSTDVAAVAV